MLMPRLALVLVVTLATLGVAERAGADDVRAAIDAANAKFKTAFMRGDADACAALYTSDAKVIAPGAAIASGTTAIAAFWKGVIDQGVANLTLTTTAVESTGDLAYEDGIVNLVPKRGQASPARYVVVWKRVDGTWKLHRDIWN